MTLQPDPILQPTLDFAPWRSPQGHRLPGTGPVDVSRWLAADAAYGAQMALRERLLAHRRHEVLAQRPGAEAALIETYRTVLAWLGNHSGVEIGEAEAKRPDGACVSLDAADPLATLGRLVQQDLCVLEPSDGAHVLTAAVLCFPASWTLSEKIGRPMTAIHAPVRAYDDMLARRVQRLFEALRPGVVLERCNCLSYQQADLFQPRREADPRPAAGSGGQFVRLERQTLRKLPETRSIVFAIHTAVLRREALSAADAAALAVHLRAGPVSETITERT